MITGKDYYQQLFSTASQAHQTGDIKKAKALYRQLTKDMPGQPEPYHMLAVIEAQNDQLEKATKLFEKAISIQPKNTVYRNNYAEVLRRQGQTDQAIKELKMALEIDPNFEPAQKKLADLRK